MATRKLKKLPKNVEELIHDDEALKKVFERSDINAYDGLKNNILFHDISEDMVKWCLEQGADINYQGYLNMTPLMYHASHCFNNLSYKYEESLQHERMFFLLLKYGADIHIKTGYDSESVLFDAVRRGNEKMIRALLDAGANPNDTDRDGKTPLFIAAYEEDLDAARLLLDNGADPSHHCGKWDDYATPLLYMLKFNDHGENSAITELLVQASGGKEAIPSEEWEKARNFVRKKGERLEVTRANYPEYSFEKSDAEMNRLYEMFGVEPPKRIIKHDGVSPIIVDSLLPAGKAHDMLWDYLVPGSGSCMTVQGEVIRITGRVADEIYRNGGANWDSGYRKMVTALPKYLGLGQPLSELELEEVGAIIKPLPDQDMTEIERLEELAVKWVSMNSSPISLGNVPYGR